MNRHLLSFLMAFFSLLSSLTGQTRIDSLYVLARHDSRGAAIEVVDDAFYVIGESRDTSTAAVGTVLSKFSLDGVLLCSSTAFDYFEANFFMNNELILFDSFAYAVPTMFWSQQFMYKYDRQSGELVEKIPLDNEYYANEAIFPMALSKIDSHRFIIASVIWNNLQRNETQLTIFDTRNGQMRHMLNRYPGFNQNITAVKWINDRIYLLGHCSRGDVISMNYDTKITVMVMDTLGNVIWRYATPSGDLRGLSSDMIVETDGGVIGGQSMCNIYSENANYIPVYRPSILKINSSRELEWEAPVGKNLFNESGPHNQVCALIKTRDQDGYIAAGVQSNYSIEQAAMEPFIDTIENGAFVQEDALLAKVSNDGDSIWSHTYSRVEQIYSRDIFLDIAQHPDGGYLLSGYVAEYIPGKPLVRTWILYVDEDGCAVPGCNDIVSTEDGDSESLHFLLYPNPASTEVYVYQPDFNPYHYALCDMNGTQIKTFSGESGGHTYIVDISGLASGTYILSRTAEDGSVISEKLIKQ